MSAFTAIRERAARALAPRVPQTDLQREVVSLRSQVAQELSRNRHSAGIQMRLGDIDEEYVPELKPIKSRMRVFDRMANDPQVRGQLRAITMTLISGVRWKTEGGTPEGRELIESNILRRGPRKFWMATSWLNFLFENMGCLVHGFAPFGVSWSRPIEGRQLLSNLTWLHPRSFDEDGWKVDEFDQFLGIRRSFVDGTGKQHTREFTSAEDLFLTCWDRRGPNWEGNAFIRPMYKPWLLNEMAEKIDMIDLQNRGVGIPVAKLSGNGGAKERDTLVSILKSLRGGSKERAFIVLQNDEEIKYLLSEGHAKDAGPVLSHHRTNISTSAGTEYFQQGNTSSGSRAGASALATGFFINVDAIRVILQDQINYGAGDQPGLVERLIERNFGPDVEPPQIVGSKVSPTEQLDNVPLIQDAVAKGVIPRNRDLANEMLERLGSTTRFDKAEWDEAIRLDNPTTLGPGSPARGGPGRPPGAGDDPRGRDDADSQRLRLAAEKKTLIGESPPPSRPASWRWLRSTGV